MHDPLPEVGDAVGVGSALDVGVFDAVADSEGDVVDVLDPDVVSDVVDVVVAEVGTTVGTVEVVISVGPMDGPVEPGWVSTGTLVDVAPPDAVAVGCVRIGTLGELASPEPVAGEVAGTLVVAPEVGTTMIPPGVDGVVAEPSGRLGRLVGPVGAVPGVTTIVEGSTGSVVAEAECAGAIAELGIPGIVVAPGTVGTVTVGREVPGVETVAPGARTSTDGPVGACVMPGTTIAGGRAITRPPEAALEPDALVFDGRRPALPGAPRTIKLCPEEAFPPGNAALLPGDVPDDASALTPGTSTAEDVAEAEFCPDAAPLAAAEPPWAADCPDAPP